MEKTAIILYSKTGNTLGVGHQIKAVLKCDLFEVKATSDDPGNPHPELIKIPDVIPYDRLIFGSPVHGFRLAKIMEAYLKQCPDLKGKKVDFFVTHFFWFAWMGGNQALKQMKRIVKSKNGDIGSMISVNWKSRKRDAIIEELLDNYK